MTVLGVPAYEPSARTLFVLRAIAILGGLAFLAGLVFAPERAWAGFLMGFVYFVGLGLAGAFFLAVLAMANARWATALRRIPEAMTGVLPYGALMGLVLIAGLHTLYEWSHESAVASDELLQHKQSWLNPLFFSARLAVSFALWIALSRRLVRTSRRQDEDGDPGAARRTLIQACWFVPVFALTWSVASFDWLMSLEPHWFSTIYALVTLSGLGLAGLAACIVLVAALRRSGTLRGILTPNHLDDLGKLAVALSLFWVYIRYCQYMLVWYTNLPEETGWYAARREGIWAILEPVNLTLNWVIPFFVLMPKQARRSASVLVRVAGAMLVGHAVDLYVLAGPPLLGAEPSGAVWEIGPLAAAIAFFFLLALRGLAKVPAVPVHDPGLEYSTSYTC